MCFTKNKTRKKCWKSPLSRGVLFGLLLLRSQSATTTIHLLRSPRVGFLLLSKSLAHSGQKLIKRKQSEAKNVGLLVVAGCGSGVFETVGLLCLYAKKASD